MSVPEQHPRELTRVLLASAWVVSAKVITAGKYGVAISFLIHWRKKKICGYCGRRTPAREICLSDEKKIQVFFPLELVALDKAGETHKTATRVHVQARLHPFQKLHASLSTWLHPQSPLSTLLAHKITAQTPPRLRAFTGKMRQELSIHHYTSEGKPAPLQKGVGGEPSKIIL